MDRTKLKNYAPKARRDFIEAMTERAAFYGLTDAKTEPIVEKGDVAVIGGRSFPISVARKRKSLEDRIKRHSFQHTMEAMAYTWFNRLVAIRYMELHGYLDHGYRVLSHPDGKPTPEILEHAEHVEFPGLKIDRVIDLKLAGNKEGELYRLLLTAQCNALHSAMPFLFERIDDETELLLPDNLLNSDSLIRKLVNEIDEADWNEVEIIGWLYQFYISERKDEVIGKVVASDDIPAATQLFTPNWIVKYLVQNTLGRQWLATYPQSALRQQMEYYIEPAEQTPEVQEQLKAITPTSLNPEELTLLDPACGSGHILVEAYDLFKAIYQERGYRAKDIPALILQKNLFGMEIDDRAAQLAAFALMMKARADDRRIFDSEARPNILAFEDSQGMKASETHFALTSPLEGEKEGELESPAPDGYLFEPDDNLFTRAEATKATASRTPTTVNFSQADIASLLELFENANTFGSLIQVPPKLAAKLPEIEKRLDDVLKFGDLTHASAHVLKPLLRQARLLARKYDAVVANPPYMGNKYFPPTLKRFVKQEYDNSKADLYACFIEANIRLSKTNGLFGLITIPNWMFLSSFEIVRRSIIADQTIDNFVHNGRGVFGSDFGSCAFVVRRTSLPAYRGTFRRLFDKQGSVSSNDELKDRFLSSINYTPTNADFKRIPGCPIAYWVSNAVRAAFEMGTPLGHIADTRQGMATTDNGRFLRLWFELPTSSIEFEAANAIDANSRGVNWFPYNKGGEYRKWFGNSQHVVKYENNGEVLIDIVTAKYPRISDPEFVIKNRKYYFRPSVSWSKVSIGAFSARFVPTGHIFDVAGASSFFDSDYDMRVVASLLNSHVVKALLPAISPTVNYESEHIAILPFANDLRNTKSAQNELLVSRSKTLQEIATHDWDISETSWGFQQNSILANAKNTTMATSFGSWQTHCRSAIELMAKLEMENNEYLLSVYNLREELSPEVPIEQITLYRPSSEEDIKRLHSYAIGCMMGRYSLDEPGLVYAHSGNQGFDPSQYKTFRADDDGIIPLLETDWGIRDDAANRFAEFVSVAWPKEHLDDNLKFVADSLGPNSGEQPRETIRRFLATGFYKHHLSMYKKRPIYWLFSSGKQRAFQCLVYLHRYNDGTLARMRTEYVIPLQGKIAARIDQLEGDKTKATSTSHRNKIQKEQDKLKKQQVELATFEEKLKHYADMRIVLDLDDGVKVNYAKFGDLLAEYKAITGGKDDD
jgi:type II restriction/modification system DNA methylase subunit YeeA